MTIVDITVSAIAPDKGEISAGLIPCASISLTNSGGIIVMASRLEQDQKQKIVNKLFPYIKWAWDNCEGKWWLEKESIAGIYPLDSICMGFELASDMAKAIEDAPIPTHFSVIV
jgi:hypothetical protein